MATIEQKSVIFKGTATGDVLKLYPETTADQVKTTNGGNLEDDLKTMSDNIHDTTYSISRVGDNIVLTDSDGNEDSQPINNFTEARVGNWKIKSGTDADTGEDVIEISLAPSVETSDFNNL
jgi:hypothetical protein